MPAYLVQGVVFFLQHLLYCEQCTCFGFWNKVEVTQFGNDPRVARFSHSTDGCIDSVIAPGLQELVEVQERFQD